MENCKPKNWRQNMKDDTWLLCLKKTQGNINLPM